MATIGHSAVLFLTMVALVQGGKVSKGGTGGGVGGGGGGEKKEKNDKSCEMFKHKKPLEATTIEAAKSEGRKHCSKSQEKCKVGKKNDNIIIKKCENNFYWTSKKNTCTDNSCQVSQVYVVSCCDNHCPEDERRGFTGTEKDLEKIKKLEATNLDAAKRKSREEYCKKEKDNNKVFYIIKKADNSFYHGKEDKKIEEKLSDPGVDSDVQVYITHCCRKETTVGSTEPVGPGPNPTSVATTETPTPESTSVATTDTPTPEPTSVVTTETSTPESTSVATERATQTGASRPHPPTTTAAQTTEQLHVPENYHVQQYSKTKVCTESGILSAMKVRSELECAVKCMKNSSCKGFRFESTDAKCHLFETSCTTESENEDNKLGWIKF